MFKSMPYKFNSEGKVGINNNSNICLSYITQKKHIEDSWFEKLNGRIFGCDTCQRACPYNKKLSLVILENLNLMNIWKELN